MVVFQQPTQSLATRDVAISRADVVFRFNELIAPTLVVAFEMVVQDILSDAPAE